MITSPKVTLHETLARTERCRHIIVSTESFSLDPSPFVDQRPLDPYRYFVDQKVVIAIHTNALELPAQETELLLGSNAELHIKYKTSVQASNKVELSAPEGHRTFVELKGPIRIMSLSVDSSNCAFEVMDGEFYGPVCALRAENKQVMTHQRKLNSAFEDIEASALAALVPPGPGLTTKWYYPACEPRVTCPSTPTGSGYTPNAHIVSFDTPDNLVGSGIGSNVTIVFEGYFNATVTGWYKFSARVDDSIRIFFGTPAQLILDHWVPTCWCDPTRWPALNSLLLQANSEYYIRIEYADLGGDAFLALGYDVFESETSTTATLSVPEVPTTQFATSSISNNSVVITSKPKGLSLTWYSPACDPKINCPPVSNGTLTSDDAVVNSLLDYAPLVKGVPVRGNLAFVYRGYFNPSISGWYNFYARVDDGVRLFVGDLSKPLLEHWEQTCWCDLTLWTATGLRYLIANNPVPIRIEYADFGGEALLLLGYNISSAIDSPPFRSVDSIPADQFTNDGATTQAQFNIDTPKPVSAPKTVNVGIIAGIAVGTVAGVALVALTVYGAVRQARRRRVTEERAVAWNGGAIRVRPHTGGPVEIV
eukprot:CAMPEP_0184672842 /NCGR_PEP_ID=MMETSP0308-20130426/86320_1 /TAXON_ID=38269 /ORGANISM="Gloeochaete witrockiana, Strain SAG 46.84" /LENGTH=592 /DNA_ID=CAMNT_0027120237 /DNA_START=256 /DNA_END=2034 /DNA_ORIENTATION=+